MILYGNKLKELREQKELTQDELAKILQIDRGAYGKYEREYIIIPIKHLNNICAYFNVSLDYIFSFTTTTSANYSNSNNEIDKVKSGQRLKEFRKENNLTQVKLANLLNTFHQVIGNYEKGINIISTPFLYTICKKYNISADYLLGKVDSPKYLK